MQEEHKKMKFDKKIIIIIAAIAALVVIAVVATLVACGNSGNTPEGSESESTINLPEGSGESNEGENTEKEPTETGKEPEGTKAENPDKYTYADCNKTLYVYINGGGSVTLRSASYEYVTEIPHGTALTVIAVSTDAEGYWSKVVFGSKTGYVASKFLTPINVNEPQDFVAVDKTVTIEPMTGSLKVRDIPSMNGVVIGYVNTKAPVKVIAENTVDGWYKIEFTDANGKTATGYIVSDSKYFVGGETETEGETTSAETESAETESETETETETEPKSGK